MLHLCKFEFAIFKRAIDKGAIFHLACVKDTGLEGHIGESGERKQRARNGQVFVISRIYGFIFNDLILSRSLGHIDSSTFLSGEMVG